MKNSHKAKPKGRRKLTQLESALCWTAGILLMILIAMVVLIPYLAPPVFNDEPTVVPTTQPKPTEQTEETTVPTTVETTVPMETDPVMLPDMAARYAENPDIAGWITIEGTVLDYPVMYTPEDGEKYIYANFEGKWNANGLPFIEDDCTLDPESDNLIIYGHNMNSGAMFASLMKYKNKAYWEQYPVIKFKTLYEEREYEIIAAFEDRVYYKYEDCFKFYQFIDAKDEAHYQEAITYFKEHCPYDTGLDAQYGDRLITLVTCAYHVEDGRFVVVAREKTK